MPNERDVLQQFFAQQEAAEKRRSKRRRTLSPRRCEVRFCDASNDVSTRTGRLKFPNGVCCKKLHCIAKYTPKQVLLLRQSLKDRPRNSADRRAFLSHRYKPRAVTIGAARGSGKFYCDSITTLSLNTYLSGEQTLPLKPLDTQQVCASFFCWAYDVSKDQMRRQLSDRLQYSKRVRQVSAPKQWTVEQWLVDLSKYYQLQPDSETVLLPFANRASVYDMFRMDASVDENDLKGAEAIHKSYFCRIWRSSERTKHIRLRKHLRFTKCDTCVNLRERKTRTMDRKLLDKIREEEYAHYQFIKQERGGYYLRRKFATRLPLEVLSIIIDGADWYSYAIPYFATKTHTSSKLFRVPIYLMGLIAHGRGSKCYVIPGHFKQGTNVVLDVLIRYLKSLKLTGQNIPKTLYLQLDNTCKQNKNKYLIGVLAYLVNSGVFSEILVSFLPKGHTHEDIDQLFSRLVIALLCRDARSVAELLRIIRSAYRDKHGRHTETEEVSAPANLSQWIAPYLHNMDGITRFRQFKIKRNDSDSIILRVRTDTLGSEWRGIEEKTEFTYVFRTALPPCIPDLEPCQRRDPPCEDDQKQYEKSIEMVNVKKYFY
jgi:hypothetical protein